MNKPPRVTLVSPTWPPSIDGIADYSRRLAEELSERLGEVTVVASRTPTPLPSAVTGVNLKPVGRNWDLSEAYQIARQVAATNAGIFHVQFPDTKRVGSWALPLLPLLLPRRAERKIVTTFHNFGPASSQSARAGAFLLARASDYLIVTNERHHSLVLRILRRAARCRVAVVPVGSTIAVEPLCSTQRRQARRDLGVDDDRPLLCFFGNPGPEKGIDLLLQAVDHLRDKCLPFRLALLSDYNPESEYHRYIRSRIGDLNLWEVVTYTGYQSEEKVSTSLSASDLAIFPFVDGVSGMRTSCMAALDHHLPTISTYTEQTPQSFFDIPGLHLVRAGNVGALENEIERCLTERERRAASTSPARAPGFFSWDTIVGQHITLYSRLLDSDSAALQH